MAGAAGGQDLQTTEYINKSTIEGTGWTLFSDAYEYLNTLPTIHLFMDCLVLPRRVSL